MAQSVGGAGPVKHNIVYILCKHILYVLCKHIVYKFSLIPGVKAGFNLTHLAG